MKKSLFVLSALVVFGACGASVNPALQQKISSLFSRSSSQSYGAKSFSKPKPYATGQYTVVGATMDGKKMISRFAIVGQEQGGWILETQSISESHEGITQMLVRGMEKIQETGNTDDVDIVWVKTKTDDGEVQTIDGPVLSITKGIYRKSLGGLSFSLGTPVDGGGVVVPAGSFAGTTKVHFEGSVLGRSFESDGWFHPDVPINGMVKSVSSDGGTVQELLAFGTDAKRSF